MLAEYKESNDAYKRNCLCYNRRGGDSDFALRLVSERKIDELLDEHDKNTVYYGLDFVKQQIENDAKLAKMLQEKYKEEKMI